MASPQGSEPLSALYLSQDQRGYPGIKRILPRRATVGRTGYRSGDPALFRGSTDILELCQIDVDLVANDHDRRFLGQTVAQGQIGTDEIPIRRQGELTIRFRARRRCRLVVGSTADHEVGGRGQKGR